MPVDTEQIAEDPPAPLAGPIAPGTYVMTAKFRYNGRRGTSGTTRDGYPASTMLINTGPMSDTIEVVTDDVNGCDHLRFKADLTFVGESMILDEYCPDNRLLVWQYTATATTLEIFDPTGAVADVNVYTRLE
jgi:hypothetical protein